MTAPPDGRRLVLIDGLRGLAALSVAAFHIYPGTLGAAGSARALPLLDAVARRGWLGVQVFFVISGLVIAHSLRDAEVTWRGAARFVLRRQVRLDPPYWAMLAVAVLAPCVRQLTDPGARVRVPGAAQLAAHVFYLQGVLGLGHVYTVFWTLCLEVQFYLGYIALLGVARALSGGGRTRPSVALGVLLAPCAYSLWLLWRNRTMGGWCLPHFYLFGVGVLAAWTLAGRVRPAWLAATAALLAVVGLRAVRLEPLAAAVVAALVLAASRADALGRWLGGRLFQSLGRVSYSLYLVHTAVVTELVWRLDRWMPSTSLRVGGGKFALTLAASLAAAHVLFVLVERPSLRLAARLRDRGLAAGRAAETTAALAAQAPADVAIAAPHGHRGR